MKRDELDFVRNMFDGIAPHYDFLNRLLSLRQDVYWRKTLAAALHLPAGARVLDAACGTADVGLEIIRQYGTGVRITGVDFAPQMLRRARPKIRKAGLDGCVRLAAADAFRLPFGASRFDAATMAFGIRNISDKRAVLETFYHHLRPGGRLAVLELGTPRRAPMKQAYRLYFNHLLPLIGRFLSKHRFAYSYLPRSVARFPSPGRFCAMMRRAGFADVRYRSLTGGITVLFVGDKPDSGSKPAG